MKRRRLALMCCLWIVLLMGVSKGLAGYVSFFYSPGEAIVFAPEGGTIGAIKNSAGTAVLTFAPFMKAKLSA
jgi:hypothetical protein